MSSIGRRLRVVREIPERVSLMPNRRPDPVIPVGAFLYEYKGITYGCLGDDEIAVCGPAVGDMEFRGVPRDAVEPFEDPFMDEILARAKQTAWRMIADTTGTERLRDAMEARDVK